MSKRLQSRISRISSQKSAENFLSPKSAEKNSASRISAEKMCQSEFGHKKIRLWGLVVIDSLNVASLAERFFSLSRELTMLVRHTCHCVHLPRQMRLSLPMLAAHDGVCHVHSKSIV